MPVTVHSAAAPSQATSTRIQVCLNLNSGLKFNLTVTSRLLAASLGGTGSLGTCQWQVWHRPESLAPSSSSSACLWK